MNEDDFWRGAGETVLESELQTRAAKELVRWATSDQASYVIFRECRRTEAADVIVLDISIEVPQIRKYGILPMERLALTFPDSPEIPQVEALRQSFPTNVPHLNGRPAGSLPSLCLYDRRWEEECRNWTAPRFIERIRSWLSRAATGNLHAEDQPLEPLVGALRYRLLLPTALRREIITNNNFSPYCIASHDNNGVTDVCLVPVSPDNPRPNQKEGLSQYRLLIYDCPPRIHGLIHYPSTLADIAEAVHGSGFDLVQRIMADLKRIKMPKGTGFAESLLTILLRVPMCREYGGDIEDMQFWAFLVTEAISNIGKKLCMWEVYDGELALTINNSARPRPEEVPVAAINVSFTLDRESAHEFCGRRDDLGYIVAVGAGSLGSQVVMNMVRCGLGRWCVVDNDVFLPHNVVRHSLDGHAIGSSKAEMLALSASSLMDDAECKSLVVDALRTDPRFEEELGKANVIIEMSASVAVARRISQLAGHARRVSVFISPTGKDLVIIAEDRNRRFRLDDLEMQYYYEIYKVAQLQDHLHAPTDSVRYGRSCRDTSLVMPQHLVALHAATAAAVLPNVLAMDDPFVAIWRSDSEGNVCRHRVSISQTQPISMNGWLVSISEGLLRQIAESRVSRLPNETGGVLIGSVDTMNQHIYAVGMLPSPSDSWEQHDLYIRGSEGLCSSIQRCGEVTMGNLEYIGEWHSHPDECSVVPSALDRKLMHWLTTHMMCEGLPAVMMIAGKECIRCMVNDPDTFVIISAGEKTNE